MSKTFKYKDGIYANINTSKGKMICKLFYDKTPLTVCNFIGLAEGTIEHNKGKDIKFYDGLKFHRVIDDFMIQGGCPQGTGMGDPGYSFPDEFDSSLIHDSKGILSMANSGPNTNGSQFFITHKETPWLDNKHTVFGKVVDGLDVIDSIDMKDTIETIEIIRVGKKAEKFIANQEAFDKLMKDFDKKIAKEAKTKKAKNKKLIKKKWPDIKSHKSGLMYTITQKGKGKKPTKGDTVTAHYTGYLLDGRKFDSSVDRGQPFEFQVGTGNVIPGWDIAFLSMKKGEKRTIVIPPELGYGEAGAGGVIPPNAFLAFDVELIDF